MKSVNLSLAALSLLILFGLGGISVHAQVVGKLFTVNHNGDSIDANPGDGVCADSNVQCTLRAAIEEANMNAQSRDVITFALPSPAVIELTLGTLVITGNASIVGPGARRLSIQRSFAAGTKNFRIFHVPNTATNVGFWGFSIRNGNAGSLLPGGGIRIAAGSTVQLMDLAIVNNAAGTGGGIANEGSLTLTRSLISSNTADSQGGAIFNSAGSVARITNSTITDNFAAAGGAIYNSGALLLVNDTISNNAASGVARSTFSASGGTINVLNTIIGNDNSSTPTAISGAFSSLGNNIVTDARGSTGFTNGVNSDQVSDNDAINPLLGNLTDNGGQTDTRALLSGSPAINAGNNCVLMASCSITPQIRLSSDQRGYTRLFADVDIGAFETETGPSGGGGSFGVFFLGRPRYGGSIAVLTDPVTNQKTYRAINPFGRIVFQNVSAVVYILEIKTKRAGLRSGPAVFAFNDFPFFSLTTSETGNDSMVVRMCKDGDCFE